MKMKPPFCSQKLAVALAILTALNFHLPTACAQGTTAFTYQGQLRDSSTNAGGAYTMIFKLYDAVTNGNQIGTTITNAPTLANGLFTVNLDFGAGPFTGSARWLDITVSSGPDTQTLSPRVAITPAPYALFALNSAATGGIGTTNITLGGGGTSWDIGIDSSGNLAFSYGDPLVQVWADPSGDFNARNNIVAVDGDFIALDGGVILNGPLGEIKFPDGSIQTNGVPNPVSGDEHDLRIIRGMVTESGSPFAGTGFSSSQTSLGHYQVTFDVPFSGPPVVTLGGLLEGSGAYPSVDNVPPSTTGFSVTATKITPISTNGVVNDVQPTHTNHSAFNFIAIGPR
jgi:hypothetical protein